MTITLNKKYTGAHQTDAMKELIKEVKSLYTVGDFLDMVNKAHGNKYHGEIIKAKFEAFASNDYTSEWLSIQAEFYILNCLDFHYIRTYFNYTEDDGLTITEDPVLFTEDVYRWQNPNPKTEAPKEPTEEETPEEIPEEDEAPTEKEYWTRRKIYDELSAVLTKYEESDDDNIEMLYAVLVKIQRQWENIITATE